MHRLIILATAWLFMACSGAAVSPTATTAPPTPAVAAPTAPNQTGTVAANSSLSSDEQVYAQAIHDQTTKLAKSMQTFVQLFENPQPEKDAWRITLAIVLRIWQQIHADAQTMARPAGREIAHATYVEALGQYSSAADDIRYAVDNSQAKDASERMVAAKAKLDEGNVLLTKALQQMSR